MHPLRIKRRHTTSLGAKEALRAHVDQLPPDQQHAFVLMATQLINTRGDHPQATLCVHSCQSVSELQLEPQF
jgi:hypothetical protein